MWESNVYILLWQHAIIKFHVDCFWEELKTQEWHRCCMQRSFVNNHPFSPLFSVCSQMSKGSFFLFGMNNVSTTETVNSYSSTFHMPYITPSMVTTNSVSKSSYQLFMRPFYTKAIVDLVRHYGWTKAYYVYDSDEGKSFRFSPNFYYAYTHTLFYIQRNLI